MSDALLLPDTDLLAALATKRRRAIDGIFLRNSGQRARPLR